MTEKQRIKKYSSALRKTENRLNVIRHRRNVIRTRAREKLSAIEKRMNDQLAKTDELVEHLQHKIEQYISALS